MKKKITLGQVDQIAAVNRLKLSGTEKQRAWWRLKAAFGQVVYLQKRRVRTANLEPSAHIAGLENVFRNDEALASLTQKEVLYNVPQHYRGWVKIKPIFQT